MICISYNSNTKASHKFKCIISTKWLIVQSTFSMLCSLMVSVWTYMFFVNIFVDCRNRRDGMRKKRKEIGSCNKLVSQQHQENNKNEYSEWCSAGLWDYFDHYCYCKCSPKSLMNVFAWNALHASICKDSILLVKFANSKCWILNQQQQKTKIVIIYFYLKTKQLPTIIYSISNSHYEPWILFQPLDP